MSFTILPKHENKKGKGNVKEVLLKKQTKQNASAQLSSLLAWIF